MPVRLSILAILLTLSCLRAFGQEPFPFSDAEHRLAEMLDSIRTAEGDESKLDLSTRFAGRFSEVLGKEGSFDVKFDSLKGITRVTSADRRVRIFTWTVGLADGRFSYFGVLQTAPSKRKSGIVAILSDCGDSIPAPANAILPPGRWYGAVYYEIIPVELAGGTTAYTLLGWRGISPAVSSRLIEVLSFDPSGAITFGKKIFCDRTRLPSARLIFRYSANASMILRYDRQSVVTGKTWNASKRAFVTKRIRKMMIVRDRIVPIDPRMEGQDEYSVPAADVMDGYVFGNGCWKLITGIDARNPAAKKKPLPEPPGE